MSAVPDFSAANDPDSLETKEWLDALEAVLEREGPERAHPLLGTLVEKARRSGAFLPFSANTAYVNTIPPHLEERSPGDHALEDRIRAYCRWNAMVMVARANKSDDELGGHIASFASVGTLFGIGQNHFWHAPSADHGGDLVFFQGHSAPGVYARAYPEGRPAASPIPTTARYGCSSVTERPTSPSRSARSAWPHARSSTISSSSSIAICSGSPGPGGGTGKP